MEEGKKVNYINLALPMIEGKSSFITNICASIDQRHQIYKKKIFISYSKLQPLVQPLPLFFPSKKYIDGLLSSSLLSWLHSELLQPSVLK